MSKGELRFWKGHGLGNDYLVVDSAQLPFPFAGAHARAICDRHRGAGADGVLVADVSSRPFRLRIVNPDGSEAEKSGNGLRIFAAWLHARGLVQSESFAVRLPKDDVEMQVLESAGGGVLIVQVEMGRASFVGADAGFAPEPGPVSAHTLDLPGGGSAVVHPVSLGNPHCVVFVDRLERADFLARAPALCAHTAYPAGTNVQFARRIDDGRLEVWIWERGAGETLASGSSACAAAAAGVATGRLRRGAIAVTMPGGEAQVEVGAEMSIRLTGPAQLVYEAVILPPMVAAWRQLTS